MLRAYIEDGRSLSSIAREWNLSVSRVSRLVKMAERENEEGIVARARADPSPREPQSVQ